MLVEIFTKRAESRTVMRAGVLTVSLGRSQRCQMSEDLVDGRDSEEGREYL